jgi:hypothetical protein
MMVWKQQKVSPDCLYCNIMCDWTVTKYVLINNTMGLNHLKKVYLEYYSFFGLSVSSLFTP